MDSSFHFQAFLTQVILTFFFVMAILVVKGKNTCPSKSDAIGGFIVALALLACISVDQYDGPCFNPAIGISQTIYQYSQLHNTLLDGSYLYEYMWAYTLGPALGGAIAGVLYHVHEGQVKKITGGGPMF